METYWAVPPETGVPSFSDILSPDDVYIPVMGMTGCGKSKFISDCVGRTLPIVGHGLDSFTRDVTIHTLPSAGIGVHLIDTPGFDDNQRSDIKVLSEIAFWLDQAYREGIRLGGVIYLHRITDVRLSGSALRFLNVFKQMCGRDSFPGVLVLTNRWDVANRSPRERAAAHERQRQLETSHEFWGEVIAAGGGSIPLQPGRWAALAAVNELVRRRHKLVLKIQLEMRDEDKPLSETSAGRLLTQRHENRVLELETELISVRADLTEARRQYHDVNYRDLRNQEEELMRRTRENKDSLRQLNESIREINRMEMDMVRIQRSQFASLLEMQNLGEFPFWTSNRASMMQSALSSAREIQGIHLASKKLSRRIEVASGVVSAISGTIAAALTVASVSCTIM